MKVSLITTTTSLLSMIVGSSTPSSSLATVAVARTFSLKDASKLGSSFDVWEDFKPCNGTPSYSADLLLVFSQSLNESDLANKAVQDVGKKFNESDGFGKCFGNVIAFGCDIDSNEDIVSTNLF